MLVSWTIVLADPNKVGMNVCVKSAEKLNTRAHFLYISGTATIASLFTFKFTLVIDDAWHYEEREVCSSCIMAPAKIVLTEKERRRIVRKTQ